MVDTLLKAIIEQVGDDDSLRLRYADELGVLDADRAEFIRLQCKLDKIDSTDPEEIPLSRRM